MMEDDVESTMREARTHWAEGNYRQADSLYTQALAALALQQPRKQLAAQLYNERGVCRYKQVFFDEAVQDYTQALELNPSLAAAYYHRATIHYRLLAGHPKGCYKRKELVENAVQDFQEALRLEPGNAEFRKGWHDCRSEMEADVGDVKVLDLEDVPLAKLVKMCFMLVNGDKEAMYKQENAAAAKRAKETFRSILLLREDGYRDIICLLQWHARLLLEYGTFTLPEGSPAAALSVIKQDEDLLTLTATCRHLGVKYHPSLNAKVDKAQKKMELNNNEKKGTFCMYSENLLMSRICDSLTPGLVYELFCRLISKYEHKLGPQICSSMVLQEELECEGIKEALFFFTIREMEEQNLLSRICTDSLQDIFKELQDRHDNVCVAINALDAYPEECQPAGLCIVFCVTEDRQGADVEITKIKELFEDAFKYTLNIEINPNGRTLDKYKRELKKKKYRFYDSLVIWFVSHGDETNLILAGNENYNREKFIDDFSSLSNFNKKPKIFFMATCQGRKPIHAESFGGSEATSDSLNVSQDGPASKKGSVVTSVPDSFRDINWIYYQMDRLVAYATLPSNLSFRVPDKGSVFVDTVCSLLEENSGKNITQVLEKVSRQIHQILFRSERDEFEGKSKQACYYECTFQKTFLVPKM